jgi:hypothetical protein
MRNPKKTFLFALPEGKKTALLITPKTRIETNYGGKFHE